MMAPWQGPKRREGVAEANQSVPTIMTEIDLTPTWEFAVQVYIAVLQNPDASTESLRGAQDELLRLARIVDNLKSNQPQP